MLVGIPLLLTVVAVAPVALIALEPQLAADAAQVVAVATTAVVCAAVGALAGRAAWAWMGHVQRPRTWPSGEPGHAAPRA